MTGLLGMSLSKVQQHWRSGSLATWQAFEASIRFRSCQGSGQEGPLQSGDPNLPKPSNRVYHIVTLRLKIAQKPCIIWSLGPKALKYEASEPEGKVYSMVYIVGELNIFQLACLFGAYEELIVYSFVVGEQRSNLKKKIGGI